MNGIISIMIIIILLLLQLKDVMGTNNTISIKVNNPNDLIVTSCTNAFVFSDDYSSLPDVGNCTLRAAFGALKSIAQESYDVNIILPYNHYKLVREESSTCIICNVDFSHSASVSLIGIVDKASGRNPLLSWSNTTETQTIWLVPYTQTFRMIKNVEVGNWPSYFGATSTGWSNIISMKTQTSLRLPDSSSCSVSNCKGHFYFGGGLNIVLQISNCNFYHLDFYYSRIKSPYSGPVIESGGSWTSIHITKTTFNDITAPIIYIGSGIQEIVFDSCIFKNVTAYVNVYNHAGSYLARNCIFAHEPTQWDFSSVEYFATDSYRSLGLSAKTCNDNLCSGAPCLPTYTNTVNQAFYGVQCIYDLSIQTIHGCANDDGLTVQSCKVYGGDVLTINGFKLALYGKPIVKIGNDRYCNVTSFTNTTITCLSPSAGCGKDLIKVCYSLESEGNGRCTNATYSNNLYIDYELPSITLKHIDLGSTLGGNHVYVIGNNFGVRSCNISIKLDSNTEAFHPEWINNTHIEFIAPPYAGANLDMTLTLREHTIIAHNLGTYDNPIIDSVSTVDVNGGDLFIYGSEFGPSSDFPIIVNININDASRDNLLNQKSTFQCSNPIWKNISVILCIVEEKGVGENLGDVEVIINNGVPGKLLNSFNYKRPIIEGLTKFSASPSSRIGVYVKNFLPFLIPRSLVTIKLGDTACSVSCEIPNNKISGSFTCTVGLGSGSNVKVTSICAGVNAIVEPWVNFTYIQQRIVSISTLSPLIVYQNGGANITVEGRGFDKTKSKVHLRSDAQDHYEIIPYSVLSDSLLKFQFPKIVRNISNNEVTVYAISVDDSSAVELYVHPTFHLTNAPTFGPTSGNIVIHINGRYFYNILETLPKTRFLTFSRYTKCKFVTEYDNIIVDAILPPPNLIDSVGFTCKSPIHKATIAQVFITLNEQEFHKASMFEFKDCAPGYFSEDIAIPCTMCSFNTYSSTTGARYCTPCPNSSYTESPGQLSRSSCICLEHTCRFIGSNKCVTCNNELSCGRNSFDTATCPSGSYLLPQLQLVVKCPNQYACPGQDKINKCLEGFTGKACTECTQGFGAFGTPTYCWKCKSVFLPLSIIIYFIVPAILVGYSARSSRKHAGRLSSLLKVITNYAVITVSLSDFNFQFPFWLKDFFYMMTILGGIGSSTSSTDNNNDNVSMFVGRGSILSLDCVFGLSSLDTSTRYIFRLFIIILYPLMVVIIVLLCRYAYYIYQRLRNKSIIVNVDEQQDDIDEHSNYRLLDNELLDMNKNEDIYETETSVSTSNQHFVTDNSSNSVKLKTLIIVSINVVMPVTWSGLFASLRCYDIGPYSISSALPNNSCFRTQHLIWSILLTIPVLILICIVYEIFLFISIRKSRNREIFDSSLAFLMSTYKSNSRSWEIVVMYRKILLAASQLIVVTSDASSLIIRQVTCILIILIALLLQLNFHPFRHQLVDRLESASLVIGLFSMIIGLYLEGDASHHFKIFVSILILLLNTLFFCVWLRYFLKAVFKLEKFQFCFNIRNK